MKLIKKYALISTSYWDKEKLKSFEVLANNLTEKEVLFIKSQYDLRIDLWNKLYKEEKTNNSNSRDLLVEKLNKPLYLYNKDISENLSYLSIEGLYELWRDKEIILENYFVEE